jgi:hypothetical protein
LSILHSDQRRSVFRSGSLTGNRWLFGACVIGVFLVVPTPYIPWVDTELLKQKGIAWEWGPIIAALFVFQLAVETYKWIK